MILVIFSDYFQFLEINEKKINYNEKKILCRKLNFGLLPKYIARGAIVLQLSAVGWKDCIAIGWVGWQIALQYSLGQPVSQDGRLCRDTALGAGWAGAGCAGRAWARGRAERAAGRAGVGRIGRAGVQSARGALGAQACRARGARGRRAAGAAAGAGARGARGARLAGWQARGLALGCALGALGLFLARFDSVFFLSQFLDIVLKPGS